MDAFAGALVLFAFIFLGSVLAIVLAVMWWGVRARKRARLEMKRHVQNLEVSRSA